MDSQEKGTTTVFSTKKKTQLQNLGKDTTMPWQQEKPGRRSNGSNMNATKEGVIIFINEGTE